MKKLQSAKIGLSLCRTWRLLDLTTGMHACIADRQKQ